MARDAYHDIFLHLVWHTKESRGLIIKTNPWAEPFFSYNQTAFLAEFRVGFTVDAEKYFSKMDGVPTI